MPERKFDKVAQDLGSDLAALREDIRRLSNVVASLASEQAETTRDNLSGSMGRAQDHLASRADRFASQASELADRLAGQASQATDRVRGAGHEIEARIERNPLTAVMIAVVGGLLIGALTRFRR